LNPFWYRILFRKAGKPRKLTRAVLFRKDRTARPLFYRVIHKKNGVVRPHWIYWAADSSPGLPVELPGAGVERVETENLTPAEKVLRRLPRFDRMVADVRRDAPLPDLLSAETIQSQLSALPPGELLLVASHDNYREVPGGVQLCIQHEEKAAQERGLNYLQFHPWQHLPALAPEGDGSDLPVTLVLNGKMIGTTTMGTLTEAIASLVAAGQQVRLVVHHLLGHSPESITQLARTAQVREVPFWLHDFFTLCPSYTLQRNNLAFCGAPPTESNACQLCVYGQAREGHLQRIEALFKSLPIVAVSPSQVTADFWKSKSKLPLAGFAVVPHVVLDTRPKALPDPVDQSAPITIGFLGGAVPHKGWPAFSEIMFRHSGTGRRFVVFSDKRPGLGEDEWHFVHVTTDEPDAMAQAVAKAKVDFVLHWASWPETFSFTTFEALTGGAWVLTNPVSGNVQATVQRTGYGAVLDDLADLDRLFADEELEKLAARRRAESARTEITARQSALSFDLPGWS